MVTDIKFDIATGSSRIELNDENTNNIDLRVIEGSAEIRLGSASFPYQNVDIDVKRGKAKLQIPKGTEIMIDYHVNSGNLRTNGTSLTGNGVFKSKGYGYNMQKLMLNMRVSVDTGSVEIYNLPGHQ